MYLKGIYYTCWHPNSPSDENNQNMDNDLYEDIYHDTICNSIKNWKWHKFPTRRGQFWEIMILYDYISTIMTVF